MDQNTIRFLIGLGLVALLAYQGQRSSTQPNRRRGFYAAAGGLLLLLGYGWATTSGLVLGFVGAVLLVLAALLLILAIVSLVRAYTSGELRAAGRRFQSEMRSYGEQRAKETDERKG